MIVRDVTASLIIGRNWAERKQWHQELQDKPSLQSLILEAYPGC